MGILLAGRKLPVDPKWTSRFISGGTIGSVALPALVGVALAENADALPVAEALFVGLVSLACEAWPSCAESHSLIGLSSHVIDHRLLYRCRCDARLR